MHASLAQYTFGPEFEVLLPQHFTQSGAAAHLSRLIGEPVHPRRDGCPDGQWKVVTDGSVRGSGAVGLEFVGPILKGQNGLDRMVKVVDALRQMGATVNHTCGFHVHVGGHDRSTTFFKNLVKLYGRYETVIDSLMPASRRNNDARYCRSVRLALSRVDSAQSPAELGEILRRASQPRDHYHSAKYHKVNVVPAGKPTVEFRHHAGTVDSVKAVNWVLTCLRLVQAAVEGKTGEVAQARVRAIAWDQISGLSGKHLHCATLVARPEGATNEEIRAVYGYATLSARTNLNRAGLPFRETTDRRTGKVRFHAVRDVVQDVVASPFPVTLDGLADLLGSEAGERVFFSRRAAVGVAA